MRRCGMAAGLVGVCAWSVVYALVLVLICATLAVPFGLLFLFDALVGERESKPAIAMLPPAPPRRPVAMPSPERLAA
jgi:hypothetical protein